jgi:hypothetical protein
MVHSFLKVKYFFTPVFYPPQSPRWRQRTSGLLTRFTPLESPAIYGGDGINKASIPSRKGGVKAPSFLTGFTNYSPFQGHNFNPNIPELRPLSAPRRTIEGQII